MKNNISWFQDQDGRSRQLWRIYIPAPEARRWRIGALELDGRQGITVDIIMHCDEYEHSPGAGKCRMCQERHKLPKPSEERYAYRWYPLLPTMRSIVQWNRRNWERGIGFEYY